MPRRWPTSSITRSPRAVCRWSASIPVELGKIQIKDLTVRGCIGSPGVWPAAIRFLERTGLDLSPIQTHQFDLDDALTALDLGKNPEAAVKVTLNIS